MTTRTFSRRTDLRDTVYAADVNELQAAIEALSVLTTEYDLVIGGTAGAESRVSMVTFGTDYLGFLNPKWYGATYGTGAGITNTVATANLTALNNCIAAAATAGCRVRITGKLGVNGSVVLKPGVVLEGAMRPVRKSTLATCNGSWLYFTGTVAAKIPLLEIGSASQTEQFDNASVRDLGLWGENAASNRGICIRSNGLLLTPTYRTKGIEIRQVVVSNFAFGIDIGPNPTTTAFATATAYESNQFIASGGRTYRCIVAGTTSGNAPGAGGTDPYPTTTGTTFVNGGVTFMDWGLSESGRDEEQSDDLLFDRLDVYGTSSGDMYVGLTCNGSNGADASSFRNFQFFSASSDYNPAIDLINGGSFHFVNGYAGGDTNADMFRIWTPGTTVIESCQNEGMRYFIYKPPQAAASDNDHVDVRNCIMDCDVYLATYHNFFGEKNEWRSTADLTLIGAQWSGKGEKWAATARYTYPLTLSGVGAYTNDRMPYAGAGWILAGEKIQRRVPTTATPLYDVVTVGGLQVGATRLDTTAYALGIRRGNAAGTYTFEVTTAGTTAGAEPGGMAAPTIGVSYADGTVTWLCVYTAPTTKTGMTLS